MTNSLTDFIFDSGAQGALDAERQGGGSGAPAASTDRLFDALIGQESGGRQLDKGGMPLTSKAGAIGVAQVMPGTAPEAARLAGVAFDDVKYRTDAAYNRKLGRAYFDKQMSDFGDTAQALAAYNAGPGAVRAALAKAEKAGRPESWLSFMPDKETRDYVPSIMSRVGGGSAAAASHQFFEPKNTDLVSGAEPGKGATLGDHAKALVASAIDGLGSIPQLPGEVAAAVANRVTGTEDYEGKNLLKGPAQSVRDSMTPGGKAAAEDAVVHGDVMKVLQGDTSDVRLPQTVDGWVMLGMEGLGSLLPTLLPVVGKAARVRSLIKAAETAGRAGEAARAAELLAQARTAERAGRVAGAAIEGSMTGGAAAGDVRDTAAKTVADMSHDDLLQIPAYADAFERTGDDQQSRQAVVNSAARWAAGASAVAGAVGGWANSKLVEDAIVQRGTSAVLGNSIGSRTARGAIGAAGGAVVEGGQEGAEKVGQNIGENIGLGRDAGDDVTRDTLGDVVGGALAGHSLGALHGLSSNPSAAPAAAPVEPAAPAPAPNSPLANAAGAGTAAQAAHAAAQPAPQPQVDPISSRVSEIQSAVREGQLLDALRNPNSPVNTKSFLADLAMASSPSTDAARREQALTRLDVAVNWAEKNPVEQVQPATGMGAVETFGGQAPTGPRPSIAQLREGVDRDAEMIAARDGTPGGQASAQILADADRREEAASLIESDPRATPQTMQRANDLRAQAESLRKRAAAMVEPAKPGAGTAFDAAQLDAQRQVNLEQRMRAPGATPAPAAAEQPGATPHDQARLEAASLAGKDAARRAEDEPRQAVISAAMRRIDERGGVASPDEARVLAEAGMGKPYDRIDETLAPPLSPDERLTQATGIALDRAPRSSSSPANATNEAAGQAAEQRAREDSIQDEHQRRRDAARMSSTFDALSGRQPAQAERPAADEVISALRTIPALRTAEQRVTVQRAHTGYAPDQLRILQAAAEGPFALSATDQSQLEQLRKSTIREDAAGTTGGSASPASQQSVVGQTGVPAFIRKRRAQLDQLAALGFRAVERGPDGFVLRNTSTNQTLKLDGPADAQLARAAAQAFITKAASRAHTSPTEAQKEAGNYRKGEKFKEYGVTITVENPKGSVRRGMSPDGTEWQSEMTHHYGDFAGTVGADGDPIDVFFIRPGGRVFVVDQVNPDGSFDEHKVMMGARDEHEAREAYLSNYEKGWTGLGAITELSHDQLKPWTQSESAKNEAAKTAAGVVEVNDGGHRHVLGLVDLARMPGKHRSKARLLQRLAAVFGKEVKFFTDPKGLVKSDGFVKAGENGVIYLNVKSGVSALSVFGHELMHQMRREQPELYAAVAKVVAGRVKDGAGFVKYYGANGMSGDAVLEELVSDLNGDLMRDAGFWREVMDQVGTEHGEKAKGMIARLAEFMHRWISQVAKAFEGEKGFDSSRFIEDGEEVRAAFRAALAGYIKAAGVTQSAMQAEVMRAGQETKRSLRRKDIESPEDRLAVSTAQPSAKPDRKTGYQPNSYTEYRVIDAKDITDSQTHVDQIARALKDYNTLSGKGNAKQLMTELHGVVVDNLLWLHDHVRAEARERAKLWYDGANRIANDWKKRFGLNLKQTGGALAVLSPQMDWFKNVSLSERVLTVLHEHGNEAWSQGMTDWAESWLGASKTVAEKTSRTGDVEQMRRIAAEGKPLSQLSNEEAAYFVRAFDEAYFPRTYRLVTPEGGFGDFVANDNGNQASITWGGFGSIEKAVGLYRDPSFAAVDKLLGGEHKVRNFYNNIVDPKSADGHVTIDTHAVAAAFIKPLSGSSTEVLHNLGGLGSTAATGASGSYGLYADAYRDAAAQRGILAREMQSITWEAIRALFPAELKSGLSDKVSEVWDRVRAGVLSREQARDEIVEMSGGVRAFAWEGGGAGAFASDGATSFEAAVAGNPAEREVRTLAAGAAKDKVSVTLSAATTTIPGLAELHRLASRGDLLAHQLLQDIALDSLQHLTDGTSARIVAERATGLYGGSAEPSLGLVISFTDTDREQVLAALAKFAENFNQEQVHVRQGTKAKAGAQFEDGSYATPVYRWQLNRALDRKQIQRVIDQSGLYGLTFGDDFVEAYFVGDVRDEQALEEFGLGADRAGRLLGKATEGVGRSTARLWPYGQGDGAIGYDRIRGDVAPGPAAASRTAQRVAEYLNRDGDKPGKVKAFAQAAAVSPEQAALQREIGDLYETLPDNDLKNPRVKRAYVELAKEVVRQFKALPVKVEVLTDHGEPYRNSDAMRRDLLDNNHLFIFGTTPSAFGPEGVDFSGHPLLEDSGQKDANGRPLLMNDLLRAVHDYYAHAMSETQFGPRGEEAAWKNHMAATGNPWARWALTAETRGQNSWVNFRGDLDPATPAGDRPFARQKAVLLPVEYSLTGDATVDRPMKQFIKELPEAQRQGTKASITKSTKRNPQTQTPEFQAWFGSSVVRDADGDPLVVYTGTSKDADFKAFKIPKNGAWFTTSPESASDYAKDNDSQGSPYNPETRRHEPVNTASRVIPAYLRIQRPYTLSTEERERINRANSYKAVQGQVFATVRARGYDGIDWGDGVWVVLEDPAQIKSAIGNGGGFDPGKGDITKSAAREGWQGPGSSKFDDMVYTLQDKHVDTKRVVDAVKDAAGAIADDLDVYLQEELFHGRAAKRTQDFVHQELEPLVEAMKAKGVSISDLDEFLHARHAKEANAVIAARNPEIQDGGSGMLNQDAEAYFAELPAAKRQALEQAAAKVDAIQRGTREMMVDYSLESAQKVQGWADMFQHYVPLMREDEGGHSGNGTGQGFSIRGKEVKSRTGSTRKVVDILANIAMQRERTIVRGEKNRVAKALVGLAQANPNRDFWVVDQVPTTQAYNETTGQVETRADNQFKMRDNVMVAKITSDDGQVVEHAVVFNEKDDRGLRMASALKNLDASQLEGVLGASAKISRYFASVNTQYNPVFGVVNLMRDVQEALVNLQSTELAGEQKVIAKSAMAALRGVYADLRSERKGQGGTSQWAKLWEEFQHVGGQTGYRQMFATSTDRAKAIEQTLNPDAWMDSKLGRIFTANGTLKVPLAAAHKGARWFFDWLSDYNESMENCVRLAAYKAGIDKGMTKERAASLAKNLTVNFNRKGQVAQQAGALYAFFNASVQGTARVAQTLFTMEPGKPKTIRLSPLGKKIVYGGMLLGMMQAMALAAAGFGDDDPPEFTRNNMLIIPTGGKTYVSIPLPMGFRMLPALGRVTTEWALGGFKNPTKRALDLVALFADSFNPIGNAGLSMQTLAPTALDPLVALTENRDFAGRPIAKESSNKAIPGHELGRDTSTTVGKLLSEGINYLTGGTKHTAGVVSPTPDQIDYLIGQVTGGVGRELNKVEQTSLGLIHGEAVPMYKVPLVGRLIGDANSQASQGRDFYANVDRLNELETEIKGMKGDGDFAGAERVRMSNPEAYLITQANHAERAISKLRKQKSELVQAGAGRDEVKAIEAKITERMAALNRAVEALKAREN